MAFNPKNLQDMAYDSFFWGLLDYLLLSIGSREPWPNDIGKRIDEMRESVGYGCLITNNLCDTTLHDVMNYFKNQMAQNLFGIPDKQIRARIITDFKRRIRSMNFNHNLLHLLLISYLDLALDASIFELDIVLGKSADNSSRLFNLITTRSPHLKKLQIEFPKSWNHEAEILPTNLIRNLKTLRISGWRLDYTLQRIAECSLALENLSVSVRFYHNILIYGIIGGDNAQVIENEVRMKRVRKHEFKVIPELVTPMSRSLKTLSFDRSISADSFEVAFFLRHFPCLTFINYCAAETMLWAIELLYDLSKRSTRETPVNKAAPPYQYGMNDTNTLRHAPSFSGPLFLTSLPALYIDNLKQLEVVQDLCPHLECIGFRQKKPYFMSNYLEKLLKYPKLNSVFFDGGITAINIKLILEILGSQIRSLMFRGVEHIDLLDLKLCPRLKRLTIHSECSLAENHPVLAPADEKDFLPCLSELHSGICLGEMSRVFQQKETLSYMNLNCCHVATVESEWLQIVRLWPSLIHLKIYIGGGLTAALARQIFPQFRHLREIILGKTILFGIENVPLTDSEEMDIDKLREQIETVDFINNQYRSCILFPHAF